MPREREPAEQSPREGPLQQIRERQQRTRELHLQMHERRQEQARERRAEHQQRHRRGVERDRHRLSREEVVRAALAIVDREGLDGFSMRKLGRELGVDPMAAYYYFPNKAAVLDGIVDAILAEIVPPCDADAPWDVRLRALMHAGWRALRAHPHALPVMATHPAFTEASLRQSEMAGAILRDAGLSPRDAIHAVGVLDAYVIGITLAEVGLQPGGVTDPSEEEVRLQVAQLPPDKFPVLRAAFLSGMPFFDSSSSDAYFESGLDILIAGIKARYGEIAG